MNYKVLGQSAPSATTETDLYTVPASKEAVVPRVVVCNRGASDTTFRISIAVGGGATANKDYLVYDEIVLANSSIVFECGATMAATDELKVYAGNGNLSFSAFGAELNV